MRGLMTVPEWFKFYWRECRDDASAEALAVLQSAIKFAKETGQLTRDEAELWQRRILTCPGHDDEGHRDWCAYCGKMEHKD